MPDNSHRLGGVSILTVTPLDENGRVSEANLRNLLKFVTAPSIYGESPRSVTVVAEMGEGYTLTPEDQAAVVRIAKDEVGGKCAIIAAVFALSVRDAVEQATRLRDAGADAIMVAPVAPFVYTGKILERFYGAIGDAVDLPLIAYLNKMFKKELPSDEILKAVYAIPSVIAIKDSTGDMEFQRRLIAARPEGKLMIQTVTGIALEGVKEGADGLMVGTSNIVPDSVLEVWVHGRGGDLKIAEAAQERMRRASKLYAVGGGPNSTTKDWVAVKQALVHMGVIESNSCFAAPPYDILSDADSEILREGVLALSNKEKVTQ
jgi:4-hydroxy-tetrahydrodipicolinate synthase